MYDSVNQIRLSNIYSQSGLPDSYIRWRYDSNEDGGKEKENKSEEEDDEDLDDDLEGEEEMEEIIEALGLQITFR